MEVPRAGSNGSTPPLSPADFLRALRNRDLTAIARLRHSLRTPLNQIIGYSEMLMETAEETGDGNLLHDLKRVHTAGGQLLAVIDDGLANWKVEAGTIDMPSLRHDMRTPLNSIIGYTEHCLDLEATELNAETAADLRKISLAAGHLYDLFMGQELEDELNRSGTAPDPDPLPRPSLGSLPPLPVSAPPDNGAGPATGSLLVVDDDLPPREMLCRRLQRLGYLLTEAGNGQDALLRLREKHFDLVLLDIIMPVLDGFQTLEALRADAALRHVPVIMLTAMDDVESTVRCIEAGATDYVPKPFNPVVLRARINAALERKRLRDQEHAYLDQINRERAKSDRLLLNVLPQAVADRLKAGERTIVDSFAECTVLFADIVGFSRFSQQHPPARTVQLLNDIFSSFDVIAEAHGLEKIKTIGDAYMLVGGVPVGRTDHAAACADAALALLQAVGGFNRRHGLAWDIRVGLNSGPVVAGIIGTQKFAYDLWGDTVNLASRMESHGQAGRVQISAATRQILGRAFDCESVGRISLKNVGEMETYFLRGRA